MQRTKKIIRGLITLINERSQNKLDLLSDNTLIIWIEKEDKHKKVIETKNLNEICWFLKGLLNSEILNK